MKVSELKNIDVSPVKDCVWLDPMEEPFRLYGILPPDEEHGYYHRIPQKVADRVNDGVKGLNHHTAGGRIRFVTDSPFVAIHTVQSHVELRTAQALLGVGGFDLYAEETKGDDRYIGSFIQGIHEVNGYEKALVFDGGAKKRLITVNMPLYGGVISIFVGLDKNASVEKAPDYDIEQPIVYYGSSITQGGNASRPGNSYQAILTRQLGWNHINMGFSGSALGEAVIRDYLCTLDMKVFVLDYDHNAPTVEHLQKTHEPMYRAIRASHPDIPIVMLSRPKLYLLPQELKRKAVVKATYDKAVSEGDKNVYFVPGDTFFDRFSGDSATADNCHPNDFGFWCMAETLLPLLEKLK